MIRKENEKREAEMLAPFATKSIDAKRERDEEKCQYRTEFQRDRDRILHCKSFRRLMYKTQVFLKPEGDHYTTRLTHSLEVGQIARTISRALKLNEDLTEAVALGHDLGHTPFGHSGEFALNEALNGEFKFMHSEQSIRVVENLERDGSGLNLTWQTRDGIANHSLKASPATPEGKVVRLADKIAYLNHDAEDAIRGGVLLLEDIPSSITKTLGNRKSERITALIDSIVKNSHGGEVRFSDEMDRVFLEFRDFMFERVYNNPAVKAEENKAKNVLISLFEYFRKNKDKLPPEFRKELHNNSVNRVVCDYISGMTDRFALSIYREYFIPKSWQIDL